MRKAMQLAAVNLTKEGLRKPLQPHPSKQRHGYTYAEGHARRVPAGDSGRLGSEIGGGKRTAEKSPPAA